MENQVKLGQDAPVLRPAKKPESKVQEIIMDLLFDLLAGFLYGISVNVFTAANHIAPGGVTGIATLMNYTFHIPIGTMSLLINIPLLLVALKILGKTFCAKTLKTVVMLTLMVDVVVPFLTQGFTYQGDKILAGLMGGVLMGACIGLVLMRGSTTGGLDIVGRLIKLRLPHMSIGRLMFIGDSIILVISAIIYGSIESGLYGLICIFTSSKMLDSVLYGMDKGKMIYVISEHPQEIARGIFQKVGRGVTLLNAQGAYANAERKVILCAMRDHQYPQVKKVVYAIDPHAFVIVNDATDILGEGFRSIDSDK